MPSKKLTILGLESQTRIWETLAHFPDSLSSRSIGSHRIDDMENGGSLGVGCMGWVWGQWLANGDVSRIRSRISAFVERGMSMQRTSSNSRRRAQNDLFLLACASFASNSQQLEELAQQSVDAAGWGSFSPKDNGELHTSAWSGMLKHWILENYQEAVKQSEIIWNSHRDPTWRGAAKPVVVPWLKLRWDSFAMEQKKDFEKLWARSRKDRTVISEKPHEVIVSLERTHWPVSELWCWAHCAMALLAHRKGAEVATDPFWFPPHAVKCVPMDSSRQ